MLTLGEEVKVSLADAGMIAKEMERRCPTWTVKSSQF
jgi:hypothetical protein